MNLESLDWEVLDRLRETFLSDARTEGPYWHTITDLECYDLTYGERIGWKWDSVLRELDLRQWAPPAENLTIFDWGCGSGIAGRRVANFCRHASSIRLVLHDHSALAVDYAEHRAKIMYPQLQVERADYREINGNAPIDILVLSHVLNELNDKARLELSGLLSRARCILWVEPGTHEVSRALVSWREKLRTTGARVIAPCTHDAACGLLMNGIGAIFSPLPHRRYSLIQIGLGSVNAPALIYARYLTLFSYLSAEVNQPWEIAPVFWAIPASTRVTQSYSTAVRQESRS